MNDAVHANPNLQERLAPPVRRQLPVVGVTVVLLLAWVLTVYGRTMWSIVSIWERSETFAHGFVVLPIFLYLLWRDRDRLVSIAPQPFPPALLGLAAAGVVWYVGVRLSIVSVPQFAMIAMVPLSVWAVLGTRALKALAFPLAFLFFAVPFGEFLVPTLMNWTADFAAFAIRASGVPVFREGNFLTVPTGVWSVAEACSGLRYLIASFVIGTLFAYLSYRSPIRRTIFVAASLAVPLVANWLRAYMIVMLGHLTNNRLAAGVDHVIYGWIFFGVVMALLFWIGTKWREDDQPKPAAKEPPPAVAGLRSDRRLAWISAAIALAVTLVWPLLEARYASGSRTTTAPALDTIEGRAGWTPATEPLSTWRPDLSRPSAELAQTFEKNRAAVGLFIALYDNPSPDARAITSANQLVRTSNKQWRQVALDATSTTTIDGQPFSANASVVASDRERLAVWQWYWVNGHVTDSQYVAVMYELLAVLQGRGDPVAWIVIFTPTGLDEAQARSTLQGFTASMREPIEAALRKAAESR